MRQASLLFYPVYLLSELAVGSTVLVLFCAEKSARTLLYLDNKLEEMKTSWKKVPELSSRKFSQKKKKLYTAAARIFPEV